MEKYASIDNSSKAPRQLMIAFDKKDGSNVRFKWTQKRGFDTFGTRKELISIETPFWGEVVSIFLDKYAESFDKFFRKHQNYRDFREITVFGEFFGPNSFAGRHIESDTHDIVFFDVLCGHKNRKLVLPQDFISDFDFVPTPEVVYEGNLNDEFIQSIRNNTELDEGVVCKGKVRRGDYFGGVWTCKIKTQAYFDKLHKVFGTEEFKKYWE